MEEINNLESESSEVIPEFFANDKISVLIYIKSSDKLLQQIHDFYRVNDYNISIPKTLEEVQDYIMTYNYHVVCLEDDTSMEEILTYFAGMSGVARRKINLILFGQNLSTMQPIESFLRSADFCVNISEAEKKLNSILERCEYDFKSKNNLLNLTYTEFMYKSIK